MKKVLFAIVVMAVLISCGSKKEIPAENAQLEAIKRVMNDTSLSGRIIAYNLANEFLDNSDNWSNKEVTLSIKVLVDLTGIDSVAKKVILLQQRNDYNSQLGYALLGKPVQEKEKLLKRIQQLDSVNPIWFYGNKVAAKNVFIKSLKNPSRYNVNTYLHMLLIDAKDTGAVRDIAASLSNDELFGDLYPYADSSRVNKIIDSTVKSHSFDWALNYLEGLKVPMKKRQDLLKNRADEIDLGIDLLCYAERVELLNDTAFLAKKLSVMSTKKLTATNSHWRPELFTNYCKVLKNSIKTNEDFAIATEFAKNISPKEYCDECYDIFTNKK